MSVDYNQQIEMEFLTSPKWNSDFKDTNKCTGASPVVKG